MAMRFIAIVMCFCACVQPTSAPESTEKPNSNSRDLTVISTVTKKSTQIDSLELAMQRIGLIDVQLLNEHLVVDLQYSTDSNFLKQNIYGNLQHAYLEENAAKKLAVAQYRLTKSHPHLRIKIWDAARPISCQRKMWNSLDMPAETRGRFVSNPKNHSLHNYGCAVDVTLVDSNDIDLDLGSKFDQFDSIAQPKYESVLLTQGRLKQHQLSNRWILRKTMKEAGFTSITSEWWHFNACSRPYAKEHYQVIE